MLIYDSILENIKDIDLTVFNEVYFMELVNSLAENMKCKAIYLDKYLVSDLGTNSDIHAVIELIKVTAYCFLAEFFSLKFNAFHKKTKIITQRAK